MHLIYGRQYILAVENKNIIYVDDANGLFRKALEVERSKEIKYCESKGLTFDYFKFEEDIGKDLKLKCNDAILNKQGE